MKYLPNVAPLTKPSTWLKPGENERKALYSVKQHQLAWAALILTELQPGVHLPEQARKPFQRFLYAAKPTTFSAASFIPSATVKFMPESRITRCPSSTFVPSSRTTTGTLICI